MDKLSVALVCPECGAKANRRVSHLAHMARDSRMVCDGCGLTIHIEWCVKSLGELNHNLSKALAGVLDAMDSTEKKRHTVR